METFSFSLISLLIIFCRQFDAKSAPQILRAPTETFWLDVRFHWVESQPLLSISIRSPITCREKLRPNTQDRPKACSEAEEENFEHFPDYPGSISNSSGTDFFPLRVK